MSRPIVWPGITIKIRVGCGNLYVTVNSNEEGSPQEVFVTLGKSGGCAAVIMEALARVTSLYLRSGCDPHELTEHLRNLLCPEPRLVAPMLGLDKGIQVRSCPDAMGMALQWVLNGKVEWPKPIGPGMLWDKQISVKEVVEVDRVEEINVEDA